MDEPRYPRLHKALKWAAKLHNKQDRDGADALPYVSHPVEVVSLLRHVGGVTDEEMLCAAALHDVVEECGTDPMKIEKKFGRRVRELVVELTRIEPTPTPDMSEEQFADLRSTALLDEISKMGREAQTIKLADRLSNIKGAIQAKSGTKLQRYVEQTRRILQIVPITANKELWNEINDQIPRAAQLTEG